MTTNIEEIGALPIAGLDWKRSGLVFPEDDAIGNTTDHPRQDTVSLLMSERKEAEVRFKAVATERTRLAQELHDTLLQGFTGIGLKLDAVINSLPPALAATKELMRKILQQSDEYLVETRRAVWELRSPALEKHGNVSAALKKVSERSLQSTSIGLCFATSGVPRQLSPQVENNLLRICEEAVSNAIKHARPTRIEVVLEFNPREVLLLVRDNGRGFDPNTLGHPKNGHFGLIGIKERVESISGRLNIESKPRTGTSLVVTVRA